MMDGFSRYTGGMMRYMSENVQSYYGFDYIPASRNDELGFILQGAQSLGKQAYYDFLDVKADLMGQTPNSSDNSKMYDNQVILRLPIIGQIAKYFQNKDRGIQ